MTLVLRAMWRYGGGPCDERTPNNVDALRLTRYAKRAIVNANSAKIAYDAVWNNW